MVVLCAVKDLLIFTFLDAHVANNLVAIIKKDWWLNWNKTAIKREWRDVYDLASQ
jgi:hypothetical protein